MRISDWSSDVCSSDLLLRRFTAEHPHVALELTIGLSEDLREKLELGVLDLAFVKRTTGDGQGELVWREPLVWIVSPDFVLDPAQPVPLIALAPPAITRKAALKALESVRSEEHTSELQYLMRISYAVFCYKT